MLGKNQYDLIISLLGGAAKARDLDEYLKICVDLLYTELKPLSSAAYISIESEEKLVLISEIGGNFDQQISSFSNFSLMVRKAIKKKNILYIPSSENEIKEDMSCLSVLIPLIGGDKNMGMIGLVFEVGELSRQRANQNFYFLLSRIIGLAALMKDQITECQRMEKVNPEEMYSDKISSLGVLSSGLAHEFNNIFAVIKGYAELISMSGAESKALASAVKVIDDQTERGAKLIESLNVFVKGRDAKLSYHSINNIVDEVLAMQKSALARENIETSFSRSEVPRALGDRDQIKEAILNVLQHSMQTMRSDEPGRIEISTELSEERLSVIIRDNGTGMTQDQADMAIHPFMSGREAFNPEVLGSKKEGAGLKLAIAYGIMQSHGGLVSIHSEDDSGKEVRLIFSRLELGDDKSSKYDKHEVVFFGDTRILIVDDEEPIREFLTRVFENAGYQVLAVASGEEAVEICAFEDIDIVFLDYLMPGIKGDRVFESIKKVSQNSDIVFITGVDEIPNLDKLLNNGLISILKKPFKIEKIIKVTNDLIYKRTHKNWK